MKKKGVEGLCPNCRRPMLMIAHEFRNTSDWQMKYVIECESCGFQFSVDKESLDLITKSKTNGKERE